MAKKYNLEKEQIFAVPLSNGKFTISQLFEHHIISPRSSQDTFGFFNVLYDSLDDINKDLDNIDLNTPFSIVTSNSSPKKYGWILIGSKEITIDKLLLANKFNSLGLYNGYSTDPSVFLEPYFGLFPWDGYFKDDYLNKHLLPTSKLRAGVKFLKDFSTKELKELLPPSSPKLIQRLESEK